MCIRGPGLGKMRKKRTTKEDGSLPSALSPPVVQGRPGVSELLGSHLALTLILTWKDFHVDGEDLDSHQMGIMLAQLTHRFWLRFLPGIGPSFPGPCSKPPWLMNPFQRLFWPSLLTRCNCVSRSPVFSCLSKGSVYLAVQARVIQRGTPIPEGHFAGSPLSLEPLGSLRSTILAGFPLYLLILLTGLNPVWIHVAAGFWFLVSAIV